MGPLAALLPQAGQDGLTVPMLWDEHQLKDLQDPGIEMSVKTKTSLARESCVPRAYGGYLGFRV